jgi:enoyl-CoA hydratase/carnithine racemase
MSSPSLPVSYASLPFKDISISHVPESSPTPTKVVLLTLNRPSKFNAIAGTTIHELVAAFNTFKVDDRVKAIVITGKGPAFCAGADLATGFPALLKIANDSEKADSYGDGFVPCSLLSSLSSTC